MLSNLLLVTELLTLMAGNSSVPPCCIWYRPITVHNIQPTICTVAHLHFCANQENAVYSQEYIIEEVSIRDQKPILKTSLEVKDGYLAVPDGPGLGVEVDEDAFDYWAAI